MTLDLNEIGHFQDFDDVGIISALNGAETTDMSHVILHSLYIVYIGHSVLPRCTPKACRLTASPASSSRLTASPRGYAFRLTASPKSGFLADISFCGRQNTVIDNGKNRLFSQFNKVAFYYNAEAAAVSSKKFPENGAKPVVSPEIRPTEQKRRPLR